MNNMGIILVESDRIKLAGYNPDDEIEDWEEDDDWDDEYDEDPDEAGINGGFDDFGFGEDWEEDGWNEEDLN